MEMWLTLVLVIHVLTALGIIGLVLLQHGKGADMGAGFGAGASGSLFGATGSANFLSRTTAVLAVVFFLTSLGLAYIATHKPKANAGVMDTVREAPEIPAPAQLPPAGAPAAPKAAGAPGGEPATSKANEVPK